MTSKNTPVGWNPPVPAWSAATPDNLDFVALYLGCQADGLDNAGLREFWENIELAIIGDNCPQRIERSRTLNTESFEFIYILYWPDIAQCNAWWDESGFGEYWYDRTESARVGLWCEMVVLEHARTETLLSFDSDHRVGVSALAACPMGPIREHAYWGAMRDRIPASHSDMLAADPTSALVSRDGNGRINATFPTNAVLIRSGQDLTDCDAVEAARYRSEILPQLAAGMAYLAENREETGCFSARLACEVDQDGRDLARTFGLCWFQDLAALEAWAKSHRTHLNIYNNFMQMAQSLTEPMRLRLWHEVTVADAGRATGEYANITPEATPSFALMPASRNAV